MAAKRKAAVHKKTKAAMMRKGVGAKAAAKMAKRASRKC
jgi:hypothetical protein